MVKKIMSILLAVCIALSLLPGAVQADEREAECDIYTSEDHAGNALVSNETVNAQNGLESVGFGTIYGIQWTVESDGTESPNYVLTLSGSGAIAEYNQPYNYPWYDYRESIKKIVIEDGVINIPHNAFSGCAATTIFVPASVIEIKSNPFSGCTDLTEIIVSENNAAYISANGVLFSKDMTTICAYPPGRKDEEYDIPNSVTSIRDAAFWSSAYLKNVTIPNSVISIGGHAFYCCNNLNNVVIPDSVTSIGEQTFYNCENLTSVKLSKNLTNLTYKLFSQCTNLDNVVIPDSVIKISSSAFSFCLNLSSITIPDALTHIGDFAFQSCHGLNSIFIPRSVSYIGSSAFGDCRSLTDIYYGGSKDDMVSATINGGYDSENDSFTMYNNSDSDIIYTANVHYNSTRPSIKTYNVYCNGSYEPFTSSLEECLANGISSSIYNPQLAHMLIAMSNSVYSESDMAATFRSFGFKADNTDRVEGPFLNYSMGFKSVGDESLILVSIRGTGSLADDFWSWASNINTATYANGQHKGFSDATEELHEKLTEFVNLHRSSGKITYVITGFSRGAAVTNLLAARLLNEGVPKSDLYAYAFACPDTVISKENITTGYECIFNIADANDLVSWVPRTLWTFDNNWTKYGQSYWFSHDWTDYENLKMCNIVTLGNAHDQVKYLEYLHTPRTLSEFKSRSEAKSALDYAVEWRNDKFWNDIGTNILSFIGINCPVDVEIYASGQLVGSITNNMAQVDDPTKLYISVANDEKSIYIIGDDIYTLNLTATGDGTMKYFVQNIDVATKATIDEQAFENVALSPNKEFTSVVTVEDNAAVDVETKEIKLYVVDTDGKPEKEVLPDGKGTEVPIDVPDEPDNTYTITFNANGGTVNNTSLTTNANGKLSSLPAPTRSGYTFDGWFTAASGGDKITTETVFEHNTTVYAHWTRPSGSVSSGGSSSGSSGSSTSTTYSVEIPYVANGTITVNPKSAAKGSTVAITATPDAGYQLESLTVSDSSGKAITLTDKGNGKYTFTMPSEKVTVDAVFKPVQSSETIWSNPFADVSESEWYYDAVRFVHGNGLMNGYGDNIFAPNANLSRAMLAQILYNKEGCPAISGSNAFSDVASNAWYSDAMSWAAERGIVTGYGNGRFGPDDNITREQLAVMLWRYAGEPAATNRELHFNDADNASGYAVDALRWATENGIINGKGGGILDPKGLATRAEVAQIFMNYMTK